MTLAEILQRLLDLEMLEIVDGRTPEQVEIDWLGGGERDGE